MNNNDGMKLTKKEYMKQYRIKYLRENKDRINKKQREKYSKNKHKDWYKKTHLNASKKYLKNNPEKLKAYRIVKNNKLIGNKCEKCGIEGVRLEAHHFDYSKPDKIITLCVKCHKEIHKK